MWGNIRYVRRGEWWITLTARPAVYPFFFPKNKKWVVVSFLFSQTQQNMSDFHCWTVEISNWEVFHVWAKIFNFWSEWLHFFLFFQKTTNVSDFHCWIIFVKLAIWVVFQAWAKMFFCLSEWIYFPLLFLPKNYVSFPLLNYFCKTSYLGGFSGLGVFLIFGLESFYFPLLFCLNKNYVRFQLLNSYVKLTIWEFFQAWAKIFNFW